MMNDEKRNEHGRRSFTETGIRERDRLINRRESVFAHREEELWYNFTVRARSESCLKKKAE
jgi:hypothetical protein